MEIIGHNLIKFNKFNFVDTFEQTKKFDNLLFNFNENMVEKAKENKKEFSLIVKNVSEVILANAFGAKYIVIDIVDDKVLAKKAIKLAEFYLFDSKIATILYSINDLELATKYGYDTVIFDKAIDRMY